MGTFTIIPRNLTNSYLAVKASYNIDNPVSICFLAVLFNAQNYIRQGALSESSIASICLDYEYNGDLVQYLTDVFSMIMINYFEWDSNLLPTVIIRTVRDQRGVIQNTIRSTLSARKPGFLLSRAVKNYLSAFPGAIDKALNLF